MRFWSLFNFLILADCPSGEVYCKGGVGVYVQVPSGPCTTTLARVGH